MSPTLTRKRSKLPVPVSWSPLIVFCHCLFVCLFVWCSFLITFHSKIVANPASWLIMTSSAGWGRWTFSVCQNRSITIHNVQVHPSTTLRSESKSDLILSKKTHRSLKEYSLSLFCVHIVNHGLKPDKSILINNMIRRSKVTHLKIADTL